MLDDYQEGQELAYKLIKNSVKKNKYSHAYIIESNGTEEAKGFSIALAKYLFCPYGNTNMNNCNNCFQCKKIDDNNFIELKIINSDGMWVKKNQLEQLQKEFQDRPIIGNKKIYIIEEAEKLNQSSANSILKFLEEPNDGIIAILIVNNIYQLLPTIVSRCQIISLNNDKKTTFNTIFQQYYKIEDEVLFDEKIESCLSFVEIIEKSGLYAFTKVNNLYMSKFKDKDGMQFGFDIIMLLYREIINLKLGMKVEISDKYKDSIQKIADSNTLNQLCQKIKIVIDLKEKIKINANASLLMDKLMIELERIK